MGSFLTRDLSKRLEKSDSFGLGTFFDGVKVVCLLIAGLGSLIAEEPIKHNKMRD